MSGKLISVPARDGGNRFIRAVHMVSTVSGWTAAALLVVSLAITCQMIVSRHFLGNSTIWQTETVIYLVIAAICLGLPYVQLLRGHVNVDLLPMMMPPGLRFWWKVVVMITTMAVIALMAWYSYDYWHQAYQRNWRSPSVWGPRLWIVWTAMPLGFGLMLLQLIADFVALLRGHDQPFWLEEG